jgi:Holliday junction resolvase
MHMQIRTENILQLTEFALSFLGTLMIEVKYLMANIESDNFLKIIYFFRHM